MQEPHDNRGASARFRRPGTGDGAVARPEAEALQRLARSACRVAAAESALIAASGARDGLRPLLVATHPLGDSARAESIARRATRSAAGALEARARPWTPSLRHGDPESGAVAPVRLGDRTVGVIAVMRAGREHRFQARELAALDDLAVVAAPLLADRTGAMETTVAGLVAAVDLRDGHSGGHGDAVFELAIEVGHELGLGAEDLRDLGFAARLHDVGKLAIEEAILQKAGPLAGGEWGVIREHPVAGASVLAAIPGLEAAAAMVRSHHERFDGTGYPDGLRGGEIPLGGRILAVCDAYCAMVEDRPYRAPLEPAAALAELTDQSGSHFDDSVVDALLRRLG
jgi:HD-GYP domain-containing protein (c-di-GMP phosphodiesterase class II)